MDRFCLICHYLFVVFITKMNKNGGCGYSVEAFKNATEEVKSGRMSTRASSKLFNAPKTTLSRALKSGTDYKRRFGAPTTLAEEIEARILRCVLIWPILSSQLRRISCPRTWRVFCGVRAHKQNSWEENQVENDDHLRYWLQNDVDLRFPLFFLGKPLRHGYRELSRAKSKDQHRSPANLVYYHHSRPGLPFTNLFCEASLHENFATFSSSWFLVIGKSALVTKRTIFARFKIRKWPRKYTGVRRYYLALKQNEEPKPVEKWYVSRVTRLNGNESQLILV